MADFRYDDRSFLIDGKRVWLHDGEIHYYRFPKAEWRRVLTVAKAAGLNCVSTYVAWNYHEIEEGVWDFTGDRDFGAFLDMAAELGLYVMVRSGPYICGEWSGGGIPAWLLTKKNMWQRADDEVFMPYAEKWLRKLMEIVVPRQVTRGGTVVAVQNDNEYHGGWDRATSDYIKKVYRIYRDAGVDVAITACNCHRDGNMNMLINYGADMYDPDIYEDMIVTYNSADPGNVIPQLRAYQPGKPSIITELWTGPMVFWRSHPAEGDMPTARWIAEYLAQRMQICMYMFVGGTNHGFWTASNLATSYASAYPVGDGIRPRPKYYEIKPWASFAQAFGVQLSLCDEEMHAQADGVVRYQKGPEGSFLFAEGAGRDMKVDVDGAVMELRLPACERGVYPYRLPFEGHVVERATLQLLSQKDGTLYLYGGAGETGYVVIDGQTYGATIPARRPVVLSGAPVRVVVMDEWMAQHFWYLDGCVVMGGALAYDAAEGVCVEPEASEKRVYRDERGELSRMDVEPKRPAKPLPTLERWQKDGALEHVRFEAISGPKSHEELGVLAGYVWYRAKAYSEDGGTARLMCTGFINRMLVYVNGHYCGALGEWRTNNQRHGLRHPADDVLEPVCVQLRPGQNEIILLSEDTGHSCCDTKPMGPLGDVYADVRRFYPATYVYQGEHPMTAAAREFLYSSRTVKRDTLETLEFTVPCGEDEEVFVVQYGVHSFAGFDGEDGLPVRTIDRPYMDFNGPTSFHSFLPAKKVCGETVVRLQYLGDAENVMAHTQVYIAKRASRLNDWAWGRFEENVRFEDRADFVASGVKDAGRLEPYTEAPAVSGEHLPAWYSVRFEKPEGDAFAFYPGQATKGQLYLNGHNAGRINGVDSQSVYYLPACWFEETNVLSVFEEFGSTPQGAELVRL